jgi:two-component system, chemotaxis family, CheB/CheR fusion protein
MGSSPIVIAVACSAGGLDAVSELLSALPPECAAAFILVRPIDPVGERVLLETLSHSTILPVLRAQDDLATEERHVYVMTANTTLAVSGGRIRVTPKAGGDHHPGDILFTSLAEARGDGAIGVVLSGEGSDGACGVQAIRQSGGTTLAQHPGSARFPSMPINAIDTGCVDFVLRPDDIARELDRLCGFRLGASPASGGADAMQRPLSRVTPNARLSAGMR